MLPAFWRPEVGFMRPLEELYRFHSENLRAVGAGLNDVLASARLAVARRQESNVATHVRLYAFLLGAWAEARLIKLIHEPSVFTADERKAVIAKKALPRWHAVLEASYRRHFNIPNALLKPPALSVTESGRLQKLQEVLNDDLGAIITLRNRLAHGQWAYTMNEGMDEVAESQMKQLREENLLTLKFKAAMIESLCGCIHDIVVSRPTFDRDFDMHFRHIEQLRIDLKSRAYAAWQASIIAKHERGREKWRAKILAGG
jgi:hypothetical protein